MVEWAKALDLERAKQNIHSEYPGDWYRDPWGWPEIDWLCDRRPDLLVERLESGESMRPAKIDVAKENFGVRPAVVLDPVDRVAYQALVDSVSHDLIGDLPSHVFGWRLPPANPTAGEYSRQDYQWDNFTDALLSGAADHYAGLRTDVVSCFASIDLERLADRVMQRRANDLTARLVTMLQAFTNQVSDRTGLPQRSLGSAVLANLYLRTIDDVIGDYTTRHGTVGLRWMDDVWLFSDDEGILRHAQVDLQKALQSVGLALNLGKTEVLVDEELQEEVGSYEHSAIDADLNRPRPTKQPLRSLVEGILRRPEVAPRTGIRFAAHRMRTNEVYDWADELAQKAERMPHGSDGLARLFRDSAAWREMTGWYVEHLSSAWGAIDWSAAQYGTMFPSSEAMPNNFLDSMADRLARDPSLALTALLAQRLASWDPGRARGAIRDAIDRSYHPLHRRALSLAAVGAGEDRDIVERWLREYRETVVTLEMLEDLGWDIPVRPDFEGG